MEIELHQANTLMAKLYEIEEYESMNVSNELDIERLIKAKEFFIQNMNYWGQKKAELKSAVIRAEAQYQFTRADEKVKFMDSGSNATKAEAEASSSINFMNAKNHYADVSGKFEEAKANHDLCNKRIDAIQQHISVLQKEVNRKQFIDGK